MTVVESDEIALPILQIGNEQSFTPEENIYLLVRYLAGRCDGARQQDGTGYNKLHAEFGAKLAELPFEAWSDRQLWAARKMLQTYSRTQLADWWTYVPEIPEPPKDSTRRDLNYEAWKRKQDPTWQPPQQFRRLVMTTVDGKEVIELQQSYDPNLISRIKDIPQRRYIADRKVWIVPIHLDTLEAISNFATEFGYEIAPDVERHIDTLIEGYANRVELSHSSDGEYDIALPDGLALYPFQKTGVQYAVETKNCLIADQMGLGKTVQGLLTVSITDSFPVIVVVPASGKGHWAREAEKWIPGLNVAILTGRQPVSLLDAENKCRFDMLIVNYDILDGWKDALVELQPKAIIADECHKVKNQKSTRSKAVWHIIERVPDMRRIFMSGTPVVNRPMEFWTMIRMLGYSDQFGGMGQYKWRYDNEYRGRLEELNTRARSYFMIRRLKRDVLKELPEKQRITEPVEIDNKKEYAEAERDIAGYFAQKAVEDEEYEKRKLGFFHDAFAQGLPADEIEKFVKEQMDQAYSADYNRAYAIASRAQELLRWEGLKQLAVKGKMAAVEAWLDEFLESDEKLVVFATHTHIIERLARRYNAPYIRGDVKSEERDIRVARFQNDPNCRLIIGNIQAMGEIITLTAASNVAFIEFGWNPKDHDQAEDRCHRIGQKDSVTVWNLVAEGTIDEEISALIEKKRMIVDSIQDGAGLDVQKEFMKELRESLERRINGRS